MAPKAGSLKKINTIKKTLERQIIISREKTQIINIREKTRDITTDPVAIERIKEYYKKLYTQKFDN